MEGYDIVNGAVGSRNRQTFHSRSAEDPIPARTHDASRLHLTTPSVSLPKLPFILALVFTLVNMQSIAIAFLS